MTDETTRQLLEEWNLPQLIPTFEEHEMDASCLIDISDDNIKELIPKIGPRTIFLRHLTTYRRANNNIRVLAVDKNFHRPSISYSDVKVESETVLQSPIFFNSSELTNADISLNNEENKYNDAMVLNVVSPISAGTASISSASSELLLEVAEDSNTLPNRTETKSANKRAASSSRFQAPDGIENMKRACRASHYLNLKELLSLSGTGKYILRHFEVEKHLSKKTRNMMVELIINAMLSESEYLQDDDFENIAEKICAAFPGEASGTYYLPKSSTKLGKTTKYVSRKGKLVDKYRNLRHLFKLTSVDLEENQDQQNVINDTAELRNCADWLKQWSQPSDDEVLENWQKSYELLRSNIGNIFQKFMEDWPIILNIRFTLKLINFDFQKLFPNCHVNLLQSNMEWEQLFNKLKHIKYGSGGESGDSDELIASINEATSEDSKHAMQFGSLPILFIPKKVIKINKFSYKPSVTDCQQSLIILVEICSDVQNIIKEKKLKLKKLGLSFLPFLIVVGSNWCTITDFYLVIDHHTIKCDTVLGAIDLLFKSFHVSNTRYPVESEHIWILIQKWIYNIHTKWDKNIPYVSALLQDLRSSN